MARKPKKSSRRKSKKFPALEKKVNLRTRQVLIDYDYTDKLSDNLKQYLNDFTEEFIIANHNHDGRRIHKDKKQVKSNYDRNNARNRDIFSRQMAAGELLAIDKVSEKKISSNIDLDALFESIEGGYETDYRDMFLALNELYPKLQDKLSWLELPIEEFDNLSPKELFLESKENIQDLTEYLKKLLNKEV